jgi:FixJ family two-component response regulator
LTREVAATLDVGVRTIETQRAFNEQKLGARNLGEIVNYFMRKHLIDL